MTKSRELPKLSRQMKRNALVGVAAWTVVVFLGAGWHLYDTYRYTLETARTQALFSFEKDLIYRFWAANHGGVYVPPTEETPPNPYLSHLPNRDVTTISGLELTLVNPAYMTRQVHELGDKRFGHRGHITSLDPIRPENAADAWETEALLAFERGETEVTELAMIEGEEYLRLMKPLTADKPCLKCHEAQGYQEGDVRGGISVSVPMAPLWRDLYGYMASHAAGYLAIWSFGLAGIGLASVRMEQQTRHRGRAEQNLRESEGRLQSIIETTPLGIQENDCHGTITFSNCAHHRILGYGDGELVGAKIWDKLDTEDAKDELQNYLQHLIDEQPAPTPYISTNRRKDGKLVWLQTDWTYKRDQQGKVIGFISVITDITDRKQVEMRILAERDLQYKYLNTTQTMMVALDAEGRITMINRAGCELLGYREEELLNRNWFKTCLPQPTGMEETYPVFRRLMNGELQGVEYHENPVICRDGRTRVIAWHNALFEDETGKVVGILGSGNDITEKKQTEEALLENEAKLKTLIETLPDLVWLKDADGVYLACNHRFERFFGATEAEIVGKTDYDFMDRELADFFRNHDRAAVAAGRPTMNEEEATFADDGHHELIETIKTPMTDHDGGLIGVLAIARDITDRKRTEAELATKLDQLRRWNKATLGREGRVLELKKEVNRLLAELNRPPRYDSVEQRGNTHA